MKVAIHQAAYAPWCGYFAKIAYADAFIFLDDVQMCKNNLMNRNKIDGGGVEKWFTIPVTFALGDAINQTTFADPGWQRKHADMLKTYYRAAPYYREVTALLEPVYTEAFADLAAVNIRLIELVLGYLGITRTLYRSSALDCDGKSDDRLIALVQRVGGDAYVSGPGGMLYQAPEKFAAAGLALEVKSYHQLPYPQPHAEFVPNLSALDALFHLGREAVTVMCYADEYALV